MSLGFYVNWDETSLPSLKRALPQLDCVMPNWLRLAGPNMDLAREQSISRRSTTSVRTNRPRPLCRSFKTLSKAISTGPDWHGCSQMDRARAELVQKLVAFTSRNNFQGVTIDFGKRSAVGSPANLELF